MAVITTVVENGVAPAVADVAVVVVECAAA